MIFGGEILNLCGMIPSWYSRSMVMVLRGTRRFAAFALHQPDRLKAVRQVFPDDLSPEHAYALHLRDGAGSASRLDSSRCLRTTARTTVRTLRTRADDAVYDQFVHRRSGRRAVKPIRGFDGYGKVRAELFRTDSGSAPPTTSTGGDLGPSRPGGKDMDKLLLSPAEAAAHLSIGRSKVYELMRLGQLRSVKIGASRRIPQAALADFVAALADEPR